MKRRLLLALTTFTACATPGASQAKDDGMTDLYTAVSAGPTGCEPSQMTLSADRNPFIWKVTCQGQTFSCTAPKGVMEAVALCVKD